MKRLDFSKARQSGLESALRCRGLEESLGHTLLFMQSRRQEHGVFDESAMAVSAAIEVLQRQLESALVDVTVGQAAITRVLSG